VATASIGPIAQRKDSAIQSEAPQACRGGEALKRALCIDVRELDLPVLHQVAADGLARLETIVDAAFINNMEMKWNDVQFVRVDADITDNLIDKGDHIDSVLSKEDQLKLKDMFNVKIPELNVTVEVKGLSADTLPVIATRPEFMRRMKDMAMNGGGGMGSFYGNLPEEVTLTVNGNHPVYQRILKEENNQKKEKEIRNLADLALLSQGLLKGNELTNFINRSVEMMEGKEPSRIILEA